MTLPNSELGSKQHCGQHGIGDARSAGERSETSQIKWEQMDREKQRSLGTTWQLQPPPIARERQGTCCPNTEEKGALGKMGSRITSWVGLSLGGASTDINIHGLQSPVSLPALFHPLSLDLSNLGNFIMGVFFSIHGYSKQISSLKSTSF